MSDRQDFAYACISEEDRELIEVREHIYDMAKEIYELELGELLCFDFEILAMMEGYLCQMKAHKDLKENRNGVC